MWLNFFEDALFASIAAIGFSAISNPPKRAYIYCAAIAASGHSLRWMLITLLNVHIVAATLCGALLIGWMAVVLSHKGRVPADTFLFPSLLPMIPGIYAYRSFGALMLCVWHGGDSDFMHYFSLMASNALTCLFILLALTLGGTLPMFLMKKQSFSATR